MLATSGTSKNRECGPLLNLGRGGEDRSEILQVLFASVTTNKVSQAFEL